MQPARILKIEFWHPRAPSSTLSCKREMCNLLSGSSLSGTTTRGQSKQALQLRIQPGSLPLPFRDRCIQCTGYLLKKNTVGFWYGTRTLVLHIFPAMFLFFCLGFPGSCFCFCFCFSFIIFPFLFPSSFLLFPQPPPGPTQTKPNQAKPNQTKQKQTQSKANSIVAITHALMFLLFASKTSLSRGVCLYWES